MPAIECWSAIAAIGAAVAAISSLITAFYVYRSWKDEQRPVVSAEIVCHAQGNSGTAYDIIIRNTGRRPAKDIELMTIEGDVSQYLVNDTSDTLVQSVKRCFNTVIPILGCAETARNSFGCNKTWTSSNFKVRIKYKDFETDMKFEHSQNLKLADKDGYAMGWWEGSVVSSCERMTRGA